MSVRGVCEGVEVHVCERVSRRMCVRGVEARDGRIMLA